MAPTVRKKRALAQEVTRCSREVYAAIDTHLAIDTRGLQTQAAQDALLEELIQEKGLMKANHKARTLFPQTVETLRQHIKHHLNLKDRRDPKHDWGDIWERGSGMLLDAYLDDIGLSRRTDTAVEDFGADKRGGGPAQRLESTEATTQDQQSAGDGDTGATERQRATEGAGRNKQQSASSDVASIPRTAVKSKHVNTTNVNDQPEGPKTKQKLTLKVSGLQNGEKARSRSRKRPSKDTSDGKTTGKKARLDIVEVPRDIPVETDNGPGDGAASWQETDGLDESIVSSKQLPKPKAAENQPGVTDGAAAASTGPAASVLKALVEAMHKPTWLLGLIASSRNAAAESQDNSPIIAKAADLGGANRSETLGEVHDGVQNPSPSEKPIVSSKLNKPALERGKFSIDDHHRRRSMAPVRDYVQTHVEWLAKRKTEADHSEEWMDVLFPSGLPQSEAANIRELMSYEGVNCMLKGAMSSLDTMAESFAVNFCEPNGLNDAESAVFGTILEALYVRLFGTKDWRGALLRQQNQRNGLNDAESAVLEEEPGPSLEALYVRLFGTKDWRGALLRQQNQPKPTPMSAASALKGLVAADVYDSVFVQKLPWDIGDSVKQGLGEERMGFMEQAIRDLGYKFSEILKQSNYKMMTDEDFMKNQIQPHADLLAQKLAIKLSPHLAILRRKQKPNEDRVNAGPSNDDEWVQYLGRMFKNALVLKGKIETWPHTTFEWLWPEPGSVMDSETMEPSNNSPAVKQKVIFTEWPGLMGTRQKLEGDEPKVFCPCRASVLTTRILDM